jgi:dCTP deaminase
MPDGAVQPASVDLHLGPTAYPLRCSFLPDVGSTVEAKMREELAFDGIDIRTGAMLERNRPYLIPLIEELRLPPGIRGKANPKSSTGRLDVFTRVITDRNNRFDEIAPGYRGKLYLEVVPRSFAVMVNTSLSLNQLRLTAGTDSRVSDDELRTVHEEFPVLHIDSHALRGSDLVISDGLFLSLNVAGTPGTLVGYRAKQTTLPIDLAKVGAYAWKDYWDPVLVEPRERIVLEPEVFYLLMSAEGVCIPPGYAAEMLAYDPTAGELRTHYAGFFDPGFGYARSRKHHGSRVALEVRARDVAFMVEHRQPVCKLAFERMAAEPDVLYGEDVGSHYQGQVSTLGKQFADQTAGISQMALPSVRDPSDLPGTLFKS